MSYLDSLYIECADFLSEILPDFEINEPLLQRCADCARIDVMRMINADPEIENDDIVEDALFAEMIFRGAGLYLKFADLRGASVDCDTVMSSVSSLTEGDFSVSFDKGGSISDLSDYLTGSGDYDSRQGGTLAAFRRLRW